jgi:DNA-binding GntR family transcriptional regulator
MKSNISVKNYISDPLFVALRDRIVSGAYPPGVVLSEKELTQEFGVSRTPYREAIRKLEDMNLVTVVPRFGTYVREIALSEIMNAYEVRLRVETMAAELAAKRRTEEELAEFAAVICDIKHWKVEEDPRLGGTLDASLHDLICRASRNSVLVETVNSLRLVCARIWTSSWIESYDFQKLVYHWADIYEALKERDGVRASAGIAAHIQDSIDLMKENLFKFEAGSASSRSVSVARGLT